MHEHQKRLGAHNAAPSLNHLVFVQMVQILGAAILSAPLLNPFRA